MKFFAYTAAAILALSITIGCVTSKDLRDLADAQDRAFISVLDAQDEFQQRTEEILRDQTKTLEEKNAALEDANEEKLDRLEEIASELGVSTEEVARAVRDRTRGIFDVGKNLAQMDWLEMLLALLGTAGVGATGGVVATNRIRDQRRVLRGEPVTPTPPPTRTI